MCELYVSGRPVASQRPSLTTRVSRDRFVFPSPNCVRWFTPAILGREANERKGQRLWTIWRLEARGWKLEATWEGSRGEDCECDLVGAREYLLRVRQRSRSRFAPIPYVGAEAPTP
jgi:hypothetical protein